MLIKTLCLSMLCLVTMLFLSGCGQTGPLYLPEKPQQTAAQQSA